MGPRGWQTYRWGRLAPRTHMSAPRCYVGSLSPPRLHLRRLFKSVWSEGSELMLRPIYTSPCHPPKAQVIWEDRNPNHPQSSTIFYGIASRLGLEGGKQNSLGFLIVPRAWFGIIFVPPIFCISYYFYMFATLVMTTLFISFMFLVIISWSTSIIYLV